MAPPLAASSQWLYENDFQNLYGPHALRVFRSSEHGTVLSLYCEQCQCYAPVLSLFLRRLVSDEEEILLNQPDEICPACQARQTAWIQRAAETPTGEYETVFGPCPKCFISVSPCPSHRDQKHGEYVPSEREIQSWATGLTQWLMQSMSYGLFTPLTRSTIRPSNLQLRRGGEHPQTTQMLYRAEEVLSARDNNSGSESNSNSESANDSDSESSFEETELPLLFRQNAGTNSDDAPVSALNWVPQRRDGFRIGPELGSARDNSIEQLTNYLRALGHGVMGMFLHDRRIGSLEDDHPQEDASSDSEDH